MNQNNLHAKILVAGVGNIFLGDDGFGCEVALSLSRRQLVKGVVVKDFGIRGFDLAYAMLDPWHAVILVDALQRGEAPGTLYVVQPDIAGLGRAQSPDMMVNPHGMDPMRVLHLAASMGEIPARVLVLGCEPNDFGDELEGRMGLSPQVQSAVEEACDMIEEMAGRVLEPRNQHPTQLHTMEVTL